MIYTCYLSMCTAGRFQYGHNKECHSSSGDSARIPTPHVRMDVIEATSQSMVLASGVPWDAKMMWYHSDYTYIYIYICLFVFCCWQLWNLWMRSGRGSDYSPTWIWFFNSVWFCLNISEQVMVDRATRRSWFKNNSFCFVQDIKLIPHVCLGPFWCECAQDSPTDSTERHVRISLAAHVEAQRSKW